MKLAIVYTRALLGINAPLITVEVHILSGLPNLLIVGLPEAVVKESKERVRSAIVNSNLTFPKKRIIINLAPVDLPKKGGSYDLPIALGILIASNQIPGDSIAEYEFAGELALSGMLREINGALPFAINAIKDKRKLILPKQSALIASYIEPEEQRIYGANSLLDVYNHLCKITLLDAESISTETINSSASGIIPDLSEVKGQQQAKRALEIAAAGGHNMLMIGPPGTGKTMLANRLSGIMPDLTTAEALEVATIASVSLSTTAFANTYKTYETWKQRPFRMPHHTATTNAITGGGSYPKPGEISLAHNGILFLDELPEFNPRVLEALREPMSSGFITISRTKAQEKFPAQFQLIAAMNPCPCGQLTNPHVSCNCTTEQIRRYLGKISGPILDRIDLHIDVPYINSQLITLRDNTTTNTNPNIKSSAEIKALVMAARQLQLKRIGKINTLLDNKEIEQHCNFTPAAEKLLQQIIDKFHLSTRSYYKIIKIAQTIVDLTTPYTSTDLWPRIEQAHIAEALSLRILDKRNRQDASTGYS